ncbi:hypothetical protein SCITRI_0024 [Spiroplasma citri]|nr:hypothetical protein SCITRI_0024 [Spiroplasma citri]
MVNLSVTNNKFYNANTKALELEQNGMTIKLNYLHGNETILLNQLTNIELNYKLIVVLQRIFLN